MGPLHSVVSSNVVFGDARGEGKMAMNQSEEIAETRKRVENQYGKELASKASDAFCLAFGRQAPQVFAAIEGGIAGTLPTRAVVVEFVPQQGRIEEVRNAAEEVKRAAAWDGLRESLEEVRTPELRLQTGRILRQAAIEYVRDDFYRTAGPITAEVERSARNLFRSGPEAMVSSPTPSGVTEICWLNRSMRTRVDPRSLVEVAADPQVDGVDLPRRLEAEIGRTSGIVGATRFREEMDRSGKGVVIAIIDSEVTLRHPALKDRVIHKQNFTNEAWGNAHEHGTAVAGIAAASDDDLVGMAPEATIYHYKVLATNPFLAADDFGGAVAIQQALEDGAHVANCSWGAGPVSGVKSREARAADAAWSLGLTIVKSAGNRGPGVSTLTTPADADGVVVVGATDREGNAVQDYSSRGPIPGGMERPHLVAPGGISGGRGIDSCLVGGGFGDCGAGTSFAAPHVTGLLALILEGEPDLTPNQQRKRLLSVCTPLDGFDVNEQGAGLVSLTGLL
jgi:serine protease AprX